MSLLQQSFESRDTELSLFLLRAASYPLVIFFELDRYIAAKYQ